MLRQPLVDERVVGAEELEQTPILQHQMVEEELRLAAHRCLKLFVEVWVGPYVRMHLVEVGQPEPLGRETRRQRLRPGVPQHPPHLPCEDVGLREPALVGQLQKRRVGSARPQEEGQTGRQIVVCDGEALGRPQVDGWLFEAEHEARAREDTLQRHAYTWLEPALGLAGVIQRHQTLECGSRWRSPVGGAGQSLDYCTRAGTLGVDRLGPAREDARPARCVRDTGGVERAADGEVAKVGETRKTVCVGDTRARERPLVG